jgi:beta-lactam-binding protein with PASTA domain
MTHKACVLFRTVCRAKTVQSLCVMILLIAVAGQGCKKSIAIPDVKGLAVDQGRQTLTAAGFTTGKVTCSQGDVLPAAKILTQSPAAGASAAAGTAVDLMVDSGVAVPNLVTSNATDALITLQNTGLKAALKKQSTLDVFRAGKVSAQDVPAQTAVARDSVVTLTVATPPDISAFAPLIMQQPAYQKLNSQQRSILDALLK